MTLDLSTGGLQEVAPHLWGRETAGEWEYVDSVDSASDKASLIIEYRMAFGANWSFEWRQQGVTA